MERYKPIELPKDVVGVIMMRNCSYKHNTAYLYYQPGTLNFFWRSVKDKRFYPCLYTQYTHYYNCKTNMLAISFYDTEGKRWSCPLNYYLKDSNKQMNNELFDKYPNLKLIAEKKETSIFIIIMISFIFIGLVQIKVSR